jgi:hypothetical protein
MRAGVVQPVGEVHSWREVLAEVLAMLERTVS